VALDVQREELMFILARYAERLTDGVKYRNMNDQEIDYLLQRMTVIAQEICAESRRMYQSTLKN
jgi:hypothetical protein